MSEIQLKTAVLGGGCFWCLESVFNHVQGVKAAISGYSGGQTENPSYETISGGNTGHAEVVKVEYNPEIISFEEILHVFFLVHDPTVKNRQGNDVGPQYSSVIFYADAGQEKTAGQVVKELADEKIYENPIVTEIVPLKKFYPAEEYHQRYFEKNPGNAYCRAQIGPKLAKLREKFNEIYK